MNILQYSALQLAEKIRKRELTVVEAVEAVFSQIETYEGRYHCYISYDKEQALKQARQVQKWIEEGKINSPLAGVPIAVKDNVCTAGIKTTCGSKMLENFVPYYDATVVEKLKAAGMVMVGKTNMDEFAMGSTTETSYYGMTRNPVNERHVPGGSSGGSAAAVASKECFIALGSDTGGSVRQPASHCGVVGLKPTYGTVSRYGLVAYASSMDQIGPITKNVEDCYALFSVISGHDKKDSTSLTESNIWKKLLQTKNDSEAIKKQLECDLCTVRIGIPKDYFTGDVQAEVKEAVLQAAKKLEQAGAVVEEFELGLAEYALPAYYTLAMAEASSNLERYDGVKYGYRTEQYANLQEMYKKTRSEGFGEEVKRRIMMGSFVLSSGYYEDYYLKALKVRKKLCEAFSKAFCHYDILLSPTAPTTATLLGENTDTPIKMYQSDIYTIAANLAGIPAISIPCGKDKNGLPIGLQLQADKLEEKKLLQVAYVYENL